MPAHTNLLKSTGFFRFGNDYVNETNLKNIALTSLKTLSDFDENLRFYNNDSQAFLYENNNLIGIFELPRKIKTRCYGRNFSPVF